MGIPEEEQGSPEVWTDLPILSGNAEGTDKSTSTLIERVLRWRMPLSQGYSSVPRGDIPVEGSQVEHYLFIHPIHLSNWFCTSWTLSSNMASLGGAGDRCDALGALALWLVCFLSFVTQTR